MRKLTVLFDPGCGLCRSARRWLGRQPAFVTLEFLAAGSVEARRRYPELSVVETRNRLTAVGDDRDVYTGDRAFVTCLWALRGYRGWALRLAAAGEQALARQLFESLSKRRHRLSELVGLGSANDS